MIRSSLRILALLGILCVASQTAFAGSDPEPLKKGFVYSPKSSDIVIGKDTAPVTIVEYASLSCPHCAHFYIHILPELTKKYIDTGKVRLVYRDFPLNDPAIKAAELTHCAGERGHAFLKVLYSTQNKWAFDPNYKDALASIASFGGMDRAHFDACMADKAVEKSVLEIAKEAQDEYGVASTPSFFIAGKLLKGDNSIDAMSIAIDAALGAAAAPKK